MTQIYYGNVKKSVDGEICGYGPAVPAPASGSADKAAYLDRTVREGLDTIQRSVASLAAAVGASLERPHPDKQATQGITGGTSLVCVLNTLPRYTSEALDSILNDINIIRDALTVP